MAATLNAGGGEGVRQRSVYGANGVSSDWQPIIDNANASSQSPVHASNGKRPIVRPWGTLL